MGSGVSHDTLMILQILHPLNDICLYSPIIRFGISHPGIEDIPDIPQYDIFLRLSLVLQFVPFGEGKVRVGSVAVDECNDGVALIRDSVDADDGDFPAGASNDVPFGGVGVVGERLAGDNVHVEPLEVDVVVGCVGEGWGDGLPCPSFELGGGEVREVYGRVCCVGTCTCRAGSVGVGLGLGLGHTAFVLVGFVHVVIAFAFVIIIIIIIVVKVVFVV